MEKSLSNPVRQLRNFLEVAKTVDIPKSGSAYMGFVKTFGVDPSDKVEFSRHYMELLHLYVRAVEATKLEMDLDQVSLTQWIEPVGSFLSAQGMSHQWAEKLKIIRNPNVKLTLDFAVTAVDRHSRQAPLEPNEVVALLDEIENLILSVLESGLHEDLKATLIERLNNIKWALQVYDVYGSQVLEDTIEMMAGALIFRRAVFQETEEGMTIAKTIFGFTWKVAQLLAVASDLLQLGSGISELFPSP